MLDSMSQWNLLADCAKDWGFSSDAETAAQKERKPQFSLQDISLQDEEEPAVDLVHFAALSAQEEKALLHDLMANPRNAALWQLCLMGYSRENIAQFEASLENPLEGVEAWLLEGIKKGWLRRQEKRYALTVLDYPLFVRRLERDCGVAGNVFTVALVKVSTSDFVHDLFMQSLSKYLSKEDYLCRINGMGYALMLYGRKNFAASAVMEKIIDCFEQNLHKEHLEINFSAGLTEFCQHETAESLLEHAKQALSLPSPAGIRVKSYINQHKNTEKNSLVHSNEKRFLFFGVQ